MAEESVDQFLDRRERELIAQIAAIRGQLAPKEAELIHVQHMRSFLPGGANAPSVNGVSALAKIIARGEVLARGSDSPLALGAGALMAPSESGPTMAEIHGSKTIKELIVQALLDHFRDGGTAIGIRDFIRDAYGRTIEIASLRPQLHRLKVDGVLGQEPSTDEWNFQDGKRALYSMYDHPTSRKAMKELHDEPNVTRNGVTLHILTHEAESASNDRPEQD